MTLTSRGDGHQHIIDGDKDQVINDVRYDEDSGYFVLTIHPRHELPPGHKSEPHRLDFALSHGWLSGFFRALGPALYGLHTFSPDWLQDELRQSIFYFLAVLSENESDYPPDDPSRIKATIRSYIKMLRSESNTPQRLGAIIAALAEVQAELGHEMIVALAQTDFFDG